MRIRFVEIYCAGATFVAIVASRAFWTLGARSCDAFVYVLTVSLLHRSEVVVHAVSVAYPAGTCQGVSEDSLSAAAMLDVHNHVMLLAAEQNLTLQYEKQKGCYNGCYTTQQNKVEVRIQRS